jgi:ABC-2 type transport system permease protein
MVLFRHLYKRMMRRGRVLGLLALSSVPALVFWLGTLDEPTSELARAYSNAVSGPGYTFAIAALILTVATLRDERDEGTLPYIYMRPMPRVSLAISSIAAGAAAAVTIAFGAWLLTVASAVIVGADLAITWPGLVLFGAGAIGYAAIFVPLGYLVPRALLVGLGYIVVIESILANFVTGLAQFSIWRISLSIYADLADEFAAFAEEALGPVTPGAGGGALKIAGTLVAGLAVLTLSLRYRDAL